MLENNRNAQLYKLKVTKKSGIFITNHCSPLSVFIERFQQQKCPTLMEASEKCTYREKFLR